MITIKYPIIVEGKYDKIKLDSIVNAKVITLDGFRIFNNQEKQFLIRSLANKSKIILLTDSDGGGQLVRSFIKGVVPQDKLINLYTPRIEGKEKRKATPSKEGVLGVEGVPANILISLLTPFSNEGEEPQGAELTKADFYALGLSGRDNSTTLREALVKTLNLPKMSPNALLQAINILYTKEFIENTIMEIKKSLSV